MAELTSSDITIIVILCALVLIFFGFMLYRWYRKSRTDEDGDTIFYEDKSRFLSKEGRKTEAWPRANNSVGEKGDTIFYD